ncbi:MAG TPA: hypothetical protein VN764_12020 [Polyangiaceae bacterium]|nr:hypothetical protein [Polyangiaceae bacterium]
MLCNEDGRCAAKSDIEVPVGGAGGKSDEEEEEECIDVQVEFNPVIPNVVLLIDQSGSMTDETEFKLKVDQAITDGTYVADDCPDSPNGSSATTGWDNDTEPDYAWRWNVVRNVLFNPTTGIVKPLEDKVRFGMALYSSIAGFGNPSSPTYPLTCPMLTEVDIAFGNHQAMLNSFPCSTLLQDTPTRESLTAVAEKFATVDLEGPKLIVLATDGEPDTCECSDFDSRNGHVAEVCDPNVAPEVEYEGEMYNTFQYEQIKVALEAGRIHDELGITIEVINVGAASLKGHLDSVAAHGGAVSGASIDGTSPGALVDAFESIIDGVRSCVVDLDGEIAEGKEDTGTITLDGVPLEYNGADGWKVNSPTQIELVGASCEAIKSGDHDIDISFPCESFEPITR